MEMAITVEYENGVYDQRNNSYSNDKDFIRDKQT